MKPQELTYAVVLKYGERRFTAAIIVEDTGTYRQLVHQHLQVLVKEGVLIKDGPFYTVSGPRAMLDYITNQDNEKREIERAVPTFTHVGTEAIEDLQAYVTLIARLKALRVEGIADLRTHLITLINGMIAELKKEKNYLVQTSITGSGTARWISKHDNFTTPSEFAQFAYPYMQHLEGYVKATVEPDYELPWTVIQLVEELDKRVKDTTAVKP